MIEPKIRIVRTRGGSWWVDIKDSDSNDQPHFTILMQEWRDTVIFVNHRAGDTVEFRGTSKVLTECGLGQRTYDVLRKYHRHEEAVKVGEVLAEDDNGLKGYLTKPMLTAYEFVQEMCGKALIRLT